MHFAEPPPLSLYVHMPWCVRKCPYCDFNSHRLTDKLDAPGYLRALLADLALETTLVAGRRIESVFIGGGTPSLFPAGVIAELLQGVRQRLDCCHDMEVTLEANPGTLDFERFGGYREAGVNRLSIGVQSFDAGSLSALGRIHGPQEAMQAAELARSSGFGNVNLDLMFGLPGQSLEMARRDLARAIAMQPQHISFYQLTLEPNTPFHHSPPPLPSDDSLWEMQQAGHAALQQAGYRQYEVSAFALSGRECRHNLNYWQFGDYLGVGAGAHGKLTDTRSGRVLRRRRLRDPRRYMAFAGSGRVLSAEDRLAPADLIVEFMLNALRLNQGFDRCLFEQRTGLDWSLVSERVAAAQTKELLQPDTERVVPTALGRRFLNDLTAIFVPQA